LNWLCGEQLEGKRELKEERILHYFYYFLLFVLLFIEILKSQNDNVVLNLVERIVFTLREKGKIVFVGR